MFSTRRTSQIRKVTGHITLPFDAMINDGESEEDEDEDEEDSWLDFGDMESGSGTVQSRSIKKTEVHIVDSDERKHFCHGKFPLLQVFWTVTADIKNTYLASPPAYCIRPCQQSTKTKEYHVRLLLHDCLELSLGRKMANLCLATEACFEIFCRQEKETGGTFSLFNLESLLQKYREKEAQECQLISQPDHRQWKPDDHGKHIISAVFKTDLGKTTLRAVSHPDLVQTLSALLPYSFQGFCRELPDRFADIAEKMAKETLWEFGFRQIIFRKLKVKGVEAQLSNFQTGRFLEAMPLLYKDALYVYEVLKVDARRDGHMYMPYRKLIKYYLFTKLKYQINAEQRWTNSLDFLRQNNVIVTEQFDQDENIFLKINWQAEMDVTAGLKEIFQNYTPCDNLLVDFSSLDFDKLRKDPDQVKALKSITCLPIAVLSGSGGCGKTTVVTTLFKNLCDREEEQLSRENQVSSFDSFEDVSDDKLADDENKTNIAPEKIQTLSISSTILSTSHETNDKTVVSSKLIDREEGAVVEDGEACPMQENERLAGRSVSADVITEMESTDVTMETDLRKALASDLIKILKQKKTLDSPEMMEYKKRILMTAPTGKAARLLGSKACLPSATIHSVIMSWKMYIKALRAKTEEEWRLKKRTESGVQEWKYEDFKDKAEVKWRYEQVQILVVDECSLVSVRLFSAILNLLIKHAQLRKIILLGDIKQLPSIEPGDFLQDIFKSLSSPGFSILLTKNHRSESSLIVQNAKRISQMQMPTFDPERCFYFIEVQENGGDCERDELIRQVLEGNVDLNCHIASQFVTFTNKNCRAINELCCKHYNAHSLLKVGKKSKTVQDFRPGDKVCMGKNHLVKNKLDLLLEYVKDHEVYKEYFQLAKQRDVQVKGESSDADLHSTKNVLTGAEATYLFTGDEEVLDRTVTEMKERGDRLQKERDERIKRAAEKSRAWKLKRGNDTEKNEEALSGETKTTKNSSLPFKDEEKLCNGEVFFILDEQSITDRDNNTVNYFILSDRDPDLPNVVCVPERELHSRCKMKHSWTRTIHTYQGSESKTVIYVVGNGHWRQNWQHVYTAVTRGKSSVYIVGKYSDLQVAVKRRAIPRLSRLRHRMKEMLQDISDVLDSQKMACSQNGSQTISSQQSVSTNTSTGNSSFLSDSDDSLLCTTQDPSMLFTSNTNADKQSASTTSLVPEDEIKGGNSVISMEESSLRKDKSKLDYPTTSHQPAVIVSSGQPQISSSSCLLTTGEESPGPSKISSVGWQTSNEISPEIPTSGRQETAGDVSPGPTKISPFGWQPVDETSPEMATASHLLSTSATSPSRPRWETMACVTPPKMRRLDEEVARDTSVDTPLRENFSQALSIDGDEANDRENPIPPITNRRRKL